jgi:hypothetical protein
MLLDRGIDVVARGLAAGKCVQGAKALVVRILRSGDGLQRARGVVNERGGGSQLISERPQGLGAGVDQGVQIVGCTREIGAEFFAKLAERVLLFTALVFDLRGDGAQDAIRRARASRRDGRLLRVDGWRGH